MNYHEMETMLERLEEMRSELLQHDPTDKETPSLNRAYTGICGAAIGLRGLLRAQNNSEKREESLS